MKDGTTHLAYKPEHAIDLDTGAVVAAEVHAADEGDTTTLTGTLDAAQRNLTSVGAPPSPDDPAECVADKGYHSRAVLTDLDGGPWKTRIAEPQRRGVSRWHGDTDARRAVYNNRTRLRSEVGQQAMPGPRWDAPDVAAGPGECPQALSDPRRGAQSRAAHAPAHRGRNPEGSRGGRVVCSDPAPDQQWRRSGGHSDRSPRPQRDPSSDHLEHALGPSSQLNKHFINGLLILLRHERV